MRIAKAGRPEIRSDFIKLVTPAESAEILPVEVHPDLVFTYPILPGGLELRGVRRILTNGVAGVQTVYEETVAEDRYRYYLGLSACHNDPVARDILFCWNDPGSGDVIPVGFSVAAAANQYLIIPTPTICPPGYRVAVIVSVAAAPLIKIRSLFVDLLLAQIPLR